MHDEHDHQNGHEHLGDQPQPGDHKRTHAAPESVGALVIELREHIPFSVTAVAVGLMLAGILCILASAFGTDSPASTLATPAHDHLHDGQANPAGIMFFHLFHAAHMLFSAAATTAMFVRYEKKYVKATLVGLLGAIGVCGLSDIVMPQTALMILGKHIPMHVCIVQHPGLVVPFAMIGVLIGLWAAGGVQRATIAYHSLHVFASTMASIFYMVTPLGLVAWIGQLGQVFLFIIPAVVVPCCLSDIVFPLLMVRSSRERYFQTPHVH